MNEDLPFFSVFVRDVLAEAAELDAQERGALWSLVYHIWLEDGALPADERRLARRAGCEPQQWPAVWQVIGRFFEVADGQVRHAGVTTELERARGRKATRVAVARKGGQATAALRRGDRAGADSSAGSATAGTASGGADSAPAAPPRAVLGERSPSPSPSPSPALSGSPASAPAEAEGPPPPPPHPASVDPTPRLSAHDLLHRWGIKWRRKYELPWAPDSAASKHARDLLEDVIGAMPASERDEALGELDGAMDRYLADRGGRGESLVRNRHPFKWFVERFNSYRGPAPRVATGEVVYDEL